APSPVAASGAVATELHQPAAAEEVRHPPALQREHVVAAMTIEENPCIQCTCPASQYAVVDLQRMPMAVRPGPASTFELNVEWHAGDFDPIDRRAVAFGDCGDVRRFVSRISVG